MRFRRFVTRAFRPLSVMGPALLVVCAGLIPPVRAEEGSTLLRDTAIIAVVVLAALLVLVRVWELRWARTGNRLFTRREAWTVTLLAFLLAWWSMGLAILAHGPGPADHLGALGFVNGMFGVLVTTGVLFAWGLRRPSAAASRAY
jgi:hypothetical protein